MPLEMMHLQVPAERNAANERDAIGWILNEFVRNEANITRVMAKESPKSNNGFVEGGETFKSRM